MRELIADIAPNGKTLIGGSVNLMPSSARRKNDDARGCNDSWCRRDDFNCSSAASARPRLSNMVAILRHGWALCPRQSTTGGNTTHGDQQARKQYLRKLLIIEHERHCPMLWKRTRHLADERRGCSAASIRMSPSYIVAGPDGSTHPDQPTFAGSKLLQPLSSCVGARRGAPPHWLQHLAASRSGLQAVRVHLPIKRPIVF